MQNVDKKHSVIITDRKQVDIDAVECVTSFDEESISLDTNNGTVVVEGGDLRLENLEKAKGTVTVIGNVSGVFYVEKRVKNKGRKFFK